MRSEFAWIHLSDLHFCKPKNSWELSNITDLLGEDLLLLNDETKLSPKFLFFTGDLVYGNLGKEPGWSIEDQFKSVSFFLDSIRNLFDPPISKDNIFIVPGNHDVNRSEISMSSIALINSLGSIGIDERTKLVTKMIHEKNKDWQIFMDRLTNYREFLAYYELHHLLNDPDRLVFACTREIGEKKIGIVGLNSAWSCSSDNEKGKLWVGGHWQIQNLKKKISDCDFKLALMHHPTGWFNEAEDSAIAREIELNFDVFLHGHEHQNWISHKNNQHIRIASGACYGSSEHESGYNISLVDLENHKTKVWIRKYDSMGEGWIPRVISGKTDNNGVWEIIKSLQIKNPKFSRMVTPPDSYSPLENKFVYGRDEDFDNLSRLLKEKNFILIYGMSGIGKSTIIKEIVSSEPYSLSQYIRLRVYPGIKIDDVFKQVFSILGSRAELPTIPKGFHALNFSDLATYKPIKSVIHFDMAQFLYELSNRENKKIMLFLYELSKRFDQIKIILESREAPLKEISSNYGLNSYFVNGLDYMSVKRFFYRPFKDKPEKSWDLSEKEAKEVVGFLGTKMSDEKVNPLVMFLLALLADSKNSTPSEIIINYPEAIVDNVDQELFQDLYENVLSDSSQRMLRICALYRDTIPDLHVNSLNNLVGDLEAFDYLVRRCILGELYNSEHYYLHDILKRITNKYIDTKSDEYSENHNVIAKQWLERVQTSGRMSLPNIIAATESVFHLIEAKNYAELDTLIDKSFTNESIKMLETISHQLYRQKRFNDQQKVLELLTNIQPDNDRAFRYLGDAIERASYVGNPRALPHYKRAFRLNPELSNNFAVICRNLLANNQYAELINEIDKLDEYWFQKLMSQYTIRYYLKALKKVKNENKAFEIRKNLIEKELWVPELFYDQAKYLIKINQLSEAKYLLNFAQKHNQVNEQIRSLIKNSL